MRKYDNENGNFKFIESASSNQTGIEGVQNQRNLVTVHNLMPTLNLRKNGNSKGTTTNAQHWADLRKNASSWELSTLQKWLANAPGKGMIGTVTTADISMLSLERNSVLSELTFQHFRYDFKTLKFKIAESSLQINVYSAVLQFVLPRFISSKTGPIVVNLRWENESCLNITFLKFPSLTNLV